MTPRVAEDVEAALDVRSCLAGRAAAWAVVRVEKAKYMLAHGSGMLGFGFAVGAD